MGQSVSSNPAENTNKMWIEKRPLAKKQYGLDRKKCTVVQKLEYK